MRLIGQSKLATWVDNSTLQDCPHFIIFKGCRGCGKTTFSKQLANRLGAHYVTFSSSAEEVRKVIETMYAIKEPTVYVCEDLDSMRAQASNALLKVTEESPENAYIILHSVGTPLATLLSRAQVFEFEPYSIQDYLQYQQLKNFELPQDYEVLCRTCNSLVDFEYYSISGKFKQAYDLACKVLTYMHEVDKVNAFKILKDLALKKDQEGIEPVFFLALLLNDYVRRQGVVQYGHIIVKETQTALQRLQNSVFSKQGVMDAWVLNIINGIDEEYENADK